MDWLIPAVVATLAATLVLTLVYAFLYLHERRPSLGLWTLAWIFSCFRYVVELGFYDHRSNALYILSVQWFSLLTGMFLLWGCFAWVQRRLPIVWWVVAGLCGVWVTVGTIVGWTLRVISIPNFLFIGSAYLVTGLMFWRRRDLGQVGRYIVAVAFVLWAVHKYDYPFLRTIDDFVPWGYLPSSVLSLVVAIGLLAAYLERERQQLLDARSRMQGLLDSTQETLLMIDPTGVVLAGNETVADRLGVPAADLPGRNLFTILGEPSSSFRRQKVETVLQTGRSVEFEDERNGRLFWNFMTPVFNPDGSIRAVSIFAEDITQRRRAETERNRLFTYSVDLLCIAGFDGYFRELNPAWMRTLGWSETELKSRPWLDFVHPDDLAVTVEAGKRLAEGQTQLAFDNRYRCKDGSWRWLSWNSFPLVDQGQIFAIARDITKQKSAEQILQARETMLNSIYRAAPVGIGLFRDRAFCQVNERFCEMTGYSREEMIGQSARILYPSQEEFDRIGRDHYDQVRHYGIGSTETRWKKKDGAILEILLSSAPLDNRDLSLGVVVTATDITHRKTAEIALRESERRLSTLVSNLPGFFYRCANDRDWTMDYISNGCGEITGYSADDLIHNKRLAFNDVVHPDHRDRLWRKWQDVLSRREPFEDEYPILTAAGDTRWVWERGRGIFADDGQLLFLEGFITDITERKQVESKLRKSEEKFSKTFRLSPEMISISRLSDGTFYEVNDAFERITGYSRLEAIGRSSVEMGVWVNLQDRARMVETFQKQGGLHQFETKLYRKDRSIITVLFSATLIEIRGEQHLLSVVMDITERKQSEQAIQESEERFRRIVESSPMGFYLYEINSAGELILIAVNPASDQFTGIRNADLLGLPIEKAFPGLAATDLPRRYKEVALGQSPAFEIRDFRYDDPHIHGLYDIYIFQSSPRRMVVMFLEVTERKRAEQTIRESQRQLSTLMSNLPGIAYRCLNNPDWTMEFISEGCMALTGYPASDLCGNAKLSYNDIILPEDREMVWETVQQALTEQRPYQITYRIRAADGAVKWVWEQGRGVYDDQGRLEALEGFVSDMTARILAEQQREQLLKALQTKTEELESIIYVSSHDLRSPLVNIQGFSGELGESCRQIRKLLSGSVEPLSDHQRLEELLGQDIPSALEYITTSVNKLDTLQKGLLKICRIGRESLEIAPVAMTELIDGVIKSIRFQLDTCRAQVTVEPLPNCLADAGQLTQVFMNLIDNAIKYRHPDRSLVIRIYGRVEGPQCVYAVADNGIGIAPEHQQKVFEMFHQLDPLKGPGGEGLGLTIVKRILGRMEGQVRLESAPGVGSVFFVHLPTA